MRQTALVEAVLSEMLRSDTVILLLFRRRIILYFEGRSCSQFYEEWENLRIYLIENLDWKHKYMQKLSTQCQFSQTT